MSNYTIYAAILQVILEGRNVIRFGKG